MPADMETDRQTDWHADCNILQPSRDEVNTYNTDVQDVDCFSATSLLHYAISADLVHAPRATSRLSTDMTLLLSTNTHHFVAN